MINHGIVGISAALTVAIGVTSFFAGYQARVHREKSMPARELTMVNAHSVDAPGFDIIWSTWLNTPYASKDGQCERLRVESLGGENWLEMDVPSWLSDRLSRIEAALTQGKGNDPLHD